jgi:hypothetical protein
MHARWVPLMYLETASIVTRLQTLFSLSLKAALLFVAMAEAALIYLSDFSGYMFDVVILTLAMLMTLYCLVRAIRYYASDIKKLGL